MQFEEQLLTDGKGDQSHWSTVSFNNCMLRIPFSLNSSCINFDKSGRIIDIPYNARVMIDKRWDGNMPTVGHVLIMQYYTYLQFAEIRDRQRSKEEEQMARRYGNRSVDKTKTFQWIEKLLNKPLDVEGRYYCVWRIFAPYLINVKRLSRFDAFNIISTWLDKCNSLRRLSFSSVKRHKIDYALNNVGSYWPVGRADLEQENNLLYQRLKSEGIIYR
jgi:hypothetical protein